MSPYETLALVALVAMLVCAALAVFSSEASGL